MTVLSDPTMIEKFKRGIAPTGDFAAQFPLVTDAQAALHLADAYAQSRLYGFFPDHTWDQATLTISPDLSMAGEAFLVLLSEVKFLESKLLESASVRYKAGPVEYEKSYSATLLKGLLDALNDRVKAVIDDSKKANVARGIYVSDLSVIRSENLYNTRLASWLDSELPSGYRKFYWG